MKFVVEGDAAALDLAEIFAHEQDGRGSRIVGERGDGAIDLGEEVAGANAAPGALGGEACFPSGGALAEEIAVGKGELVADLRGAIKLAGRGRAEGAKARCGEGPVVGELVRKAEARIEYALVALRRLSGGGQPG